MFLFPFGRVRANEKIIIYGAGKAGQDFLRQLKQTAYCEVLGIADKNYRDCADLGVPIFAPEEISKKDFDKVIVAVSDTCAQREIQANLEAMNISANKIIVDCSETDNAPPIQKRVTEDNGQFSYSKHKMALAFEVPNGLGDCIIALRWIRAIIEKISINDFGIDIFASKHPLKHYLPHLIKNSSFINGTFHKERDSRHYEKYDVALRLTYVPEFLCTPQQNALKEKDKNFAQTIDYMIRQSEAYGLRYNLPETAVHFARCKFWNYNCYTFAKYFGLEMDDWHIDISAEKNDDLDLPLKYIILNYGWGGLAMGEKNIAHCKAWPLAYYDALVKLLHNILPTISLVQTGINDTPRIEGIDRYFFGESLDKIKCVVKNATLLIDCEGGMVHLATQLGTMCIVLFGPTPLHYFGYNNNINITSKDSDCRDCSFMGTDIRLCVRKLSHPECMYSITPKQVAETVKGLFSKELACSI